MSGLLTTMMFCTAVAGSATPTIRAQVDTVGFATSWDDMRACVAAARVADALADTTASDPWIAAILPHDDYLYAGRTVVPMLPGLQARTWIVIGVCHACRRLGVRDQLLFEDHAAWRIGGKDVPVARALRERLLSDLGPDLARVDDERQDAEHSVEALLPWLVTARADVQFVPILVPGMSLERMREIGEHLAASLVSVCRENGWQPGRDVGIAISADAVHYGCDGWGEHPYHPFGCEDAGHLAARAQDVTLAEATLAGPLDPDSAARFFRLVADESHPGFPYKITWCGVYSIPFGLTLADRWRAQLDAPPLVGTLVRYGDSVTDGRLAVPGTRLGVTAPNTLGHWVGYASVGYH